MKHKEQLTPERVCAIVYQSEKCGSIPNSKQILVNIDSNAEKLLESKKLTQDTSITPLTIVQLTDPHYDPNYIAGGNAKCNSGACCHRNQGLPEEKNDAAGYWGDYNRCDTPSYAVINVLNSINDEHKDKIDAIYFTGDIIDHFTYDTSKEGNIESFKFMFDALEKAFPGVPIYPVLGNHEAHPANL